MDAYLFVYTCIYSLIMFEYVFIYTHTHTPTPTHTQIWWEF